MSRITRIEMDVGEGTCGFQFNHDGVGDEDVRAVSADNLAFINDLYRFLGFRPRPRTASSRSRTR
jgi:hypothetical protein